jgi:hypothetical protein
VYLGVGPRECGVRRLYESVLGCGADFEGAEIRLRIVLKPGDFKCEDWMFGAVLVTERSDFNQWTRRVECTGGRTGRCT